MSDFNWEQLERLFFETLKRTPAERASAMEASCGDNKELLSALKAMIEAHERDEPLWTESRVGRRG